MLKDTLVLTVNVVNEQPLNSYTMYKEESSKLNKCIFLYESHLMLKNARQEVTKESLLQHVARQTM